ncbi:transposase [Rosistilla oblonga]|uniref:transposase n=1 Tax=Rosistilla oblonga TaxID=2527990 RepID=UPI0011A998D5
MDKPLMRLCCTTLSHKQRLAMTLLNASEYPVSELSELYRRRWEVELHIRNLKTHMQMEHLRCKTPSMVRKEIHCHLIGYNLVRASMIASSLRYSWKPTRLSFTNAMQALEEFLAVIRLQAHRVIDQWNTLMQTIAERRVGWRPGRQEKRVVKKQPKSYKLMRTPRNPNRNRFATTGYA